MKAISEQSVQELIALRKSIDEELASRRESLSTKVNGAQKELAELDKVLTGKSKTRKPRAPRTPNTPAPGTAE